MLTRAARRRQNLRYARTVAQQIQLPFLCPTLGVPHNTAHQQRPTATIPLARRRPPAPYPAHARQLASAASLPESFDRNDEYITNLYSRDLTPTRSQAELSTIPEWDSSFSTLIHLDHTTVAQPGRINTNLQQDNDVHGNTNELEANLDACLQLKKWPRALAVLAQLKIIYFSDAGRLLRQYNYVLAYMVDDIIDNHNSDVEQRITQWIERDMRQARLEPNAQTFALVIKAALAIPIRSKRDRTVRRYWDMARRYDLQGEVGNLREILAERDLGLISRICPLEVGDLGEFEAYAPDEPGILLNDDVVSQLPDQGIRETEQKGQGMAALQKTLSLFSDVEDQTRLQMASDPTSKEDHAYERQSRLERDAIDSAMQRWKREHEKMSKMGITSGLNAGRVGAYLWRWHHVLTSKIVEELKLVEAAEKKEKKTAEDHRRLEYGPFLQQLKPQKLAAITALGMMQILNKGGTTKPVKLVRLVAELGKIVESEHHAEKMNDRRQRWDKRYSEARRRGRPVAEIIKGLEANNADKPSHHFITQRGTHSASQKYLLYSDWTTTIHVKLGAVLCEFMMDAAKISTTKVNEATGKQMTIAQPVFIRQTVFASGKKVGIVSLHNDFIKYLVKTPHAEFVTKQLPMVCKPLPWKGFDEGGYVQSKTSVLRVKHREYQQKQYAVAAANNGDLDQILAGLDALSSVPWTINKDVFQVMLQAWNTGEEIAGLAPLDRQFDVPERPPAEAPNKEKHEWFARMRQIDNQRGGDHSVRCFQNFQLEIAKAYLKETFYLPHNMDFRGRAYPIPPYLNQMGADHARGLLLFGNGKALGETGLRWLKIHLSNVFGFDKASLSERAQFPMDHLSKIRDSVARPLDGQKWWMKAEDPWQCLATCQELVRALDSPDPIQYKSHLPIHQDGSCNGLQHYAALGGDMAGARQVNLEPGDRPADVYTGVCDLVAASVAKDAANGHEMAQLLDGRLKRKIVKQTVMTNVYGVTFMGATAQVRKQLDALLPDLEEARMSSKAALYVAEKIFKALGTLFTGAHEIQYWLGDCANRISTSISPAQMRKLAEQKIKVDGQEKTKVGLRPKKAKADQMMEGAEFRSSVIWTTPLKLPVVQPYRSAKGNTVSTNLQSITLYEPTVADSVNKRKQLQAFPPNFIHSLDATHMILSALKSTELGLDFAAVHDSFWTHACDVDTMSRLLRDAFIRMHSEDIVGRLAAEFNKRYEGHLYLAQISSTSKLAKAIQKYRMEHVAELGGSFASHSTRRKNAELLREITKRRLMESDDPQERKRGEEMVTAATLFKQFDGTQYLHAKDSLGQTAMASMPTKAAKAQIEKELEASAKDDDILEKSVDGDDGTDDAIDHEGEAADGATSKRTKTAKGASDKNIWLWLPLEFRPVPKKGDFDVKRLKESQYFFS